MFNDFIDAIFTSAVFIEILKAAALPKCTIICMDVLMAKASNKRLLINAALDALSIMAISFADTDSPALHVIANIIAVPTIILILWLCISSAIHFINKCILQK